jgi:GAF domain-containing protein
MSPTPDSTLADSEQPIADLQRQLAECSAERDAAMAREAALAEVLDAINRSPGDPGPVFEAILEKAHSLCGAATGGLVTYDGEHFRAVATHGYPEELAAMVRRPFLPTVSHQRLIDGERFVHHPDLKAVESAPDHEIQRGIRELTAVRTQLLMPLRKDSALLGLISAGRREVRPFSEREIALLESFAAQAVIAMENARLLGELRERTRELEESLEYQTATSDVLRVISRSAGDVQPVLDTVTETAVRLCGADNGSILIREGEVYRDVSSSYSATDSEHWAALRQRTIVPGRDSVIGRAALEGRVMHVVDILADPDYARPEVVAAGRRTVLGVPLLHEGGVIGTIGLTRQRVEPFTERQIELVRTFADQAVIAIENTRLITETREALEQQTATAEVLGVINSSPGDLKPVFDAMLEKAMRLCEAAFGLMQTYDGRLVHTVATRGVTTEYATHLAVPRPITPGTNHDRLVRGEPFVHIEDVRDTELYRSGQPQRRASADLGGQRTLVAVALRKADNCLGFFFIFRQEVRPFSGKQIVLLQNFAAQAVIAMENARLITETREALEQQTATAEVLQVINSSPGDLEPVFEAILDKAHALCGAERGTLFLYDGGKMKAAVAHGYPKDVVEHLRAGVDPAPHHGPLFAGNHVHVADLRQDGNPTGRIVSGRGGVRTNLLVPLFRNGALLGMISCNRTEVRPFSAKEIALIENFAAQAVIAMENARLLGELQARTRELEESLEYQTATSEVLNVISRSTSDVQPVLDTVTETAARLCDVDSAGIAIREGEVYRYVSSTTAVDPEYWAILRQRTIVPGRDTVTGRVALEGRVVHVADILADPDYVAPEVVAAGRRTALGVPLLGDSEPIGIIALNRHRVEPFTERQIELVRTFADQAVIAIENARLLGELQGRTRELEESLEYQTATSDVLKVISGSAFDIQPVFQTIVETAARLCDADQAAIYRRDGEAAVLALNFGFPAEYEAAAVAVGAFPLGPTRPETPVRAMLEGHAVHVHDVAAVPGYSELAIRLGRVRTSLGVPLMREGRAIGSVLLARQRVEPFTDRQIELVSAFADQAVIAMENARLLGELRERTRELEESLEYQTATSDVLNVISRSAANVQPVLDTVVETAARLCGADSGSIAVREGEVYRYVAAAQAELADPVWWATLRQRTIVPGRDTVAGRVALEGKVVHVADVRAIPDYALPETVKAG